MKDQKKWELLKFAYDNYPKGATYKWGLDGGNIESTGVFNFNNDTIVQNNGHTVYDGNKWADIVKPKIAVKVENEKEFKALMKYYDSLGWKWYGGHKPLEYKERISNKDLGEECFPFHDGFDNGIVSMKIEQGYQIIPFYDFSKDHNIKMPLLTSEDGLYLYEGDSAIPVRILNLLIGNENYLVGTYSEKTDSLYKYFSTKQAALDWIETQKPKTIEYVSKFGLKCQSSKDEVLLNCGCGCFSLTKKDIESISKAMQELS